MSQSSKGNYFKGDAPECASIGTQKLNACFSRQVGIWLRLVQEKSLFDGFDCDDIIFTCIVLCLPHWLPFILARDVFFNGYHLKCHVLGCCLNWHEECVKSVYYTGEDSRGRLTKSSAIGRKTRNGLVADQPLVACKVMPIRNMLLMMGVIIFKFYSDCVLCRFAHVFGLTWLGMCFHCSCSCRQCTFPPKEFSYKIFKATHHSFLNVFSVAHFILTTVSYSAPSPFCSPSIDYLLNLSYYSTILAGNTSVFCHITLPGAWISSVKLRLFFPRLVALVLLLLSFASVQSQAMWFVLNADLLNSKFLKCRYYWSRCILYSRQLCATLPDELRITISMPVLHLELLCVQWLLLHWLLCYWLSLRVAVLPVRMMTVPMLLPLLEISSSSFYDYAQRLYVICCICCLLSSRGRRPYWWWVHKRSRTNVLFHSSDLKKLTGVMPTASAQGQACYFTVVIRRSSRAWCLPQIALIQIIHSVERWLLMDVNGHVTQQSWSISGRCARSICLSFLWKAFTSRSVWL